MADTVSTRIVSNTKYYYDVVFNNICDGTGESAVKKVDISTLTGATGSAPLHLAIERIDSNIAGFKYVSLSWDHAATDVVAVVLPTGYQELEMCKSRMEDPAPSTDTDGNTGDILLTTNTNAVGNSYNIRVRFKKIR